MGSNVVREGMDVTYSDSGVGGVDVVSAQTNGTQPLVFSGGFTLPNGEGGPTPLTLLTPVPLPPVPLTSPVPAPVCFQPTARCLAPYGLVLSLCTATHACLFDGGRVVVNDVLCYSYTAVCRLDDSTYSLVENTLRTRSPLRLDRMTYAHVLADACSLFKISWRRAPALKVLIVTHAGAAAWAAMRNREDVAQHVGPPGATGGKFTVSLQTPYAVWSSL